MLELRALISRNRAEELELDVWKYFVVPPYFEQLDLADARKPRVIIGGRGCGKTMLLRYMSHHSTFSADRTDIPQDAIHHVGLYWRTDTQFCNAFKKRGIADHVWNSAFEHYVALVLSLELLGALNSIASSTYPSFNYDDLERIDFSRLAAFDSAMPHEPGDAYQYFETRLWEFESWVNNPGTKPTPLFLPGVKFLAHAITLLKRQIAPLKEAGFQVYIDEYENLSTEQQKTINTWLKHSEHPLIFNIAMKRNAFETRKTVGAESLSYVHDMRQIDLEELLLDSNYEVFSAEILFLELALTDAPFQIPARTGLLRDPARLAERKSNEYKKSVLSCINQIFPTPTQKELAQLALQDKSIRSRIKSVIQAAAPQAANASEKLFRESEPEATVVVPVLLNRPRITVEQILHELDKLEAGEENQFTSKKAWIHNNFVGALLHAYEPYSKACPFYAGFRAFLALSHGNIRHFLELCNKSINRALDDEGKVTFPVPIERQAEAARQASTDFINEVRTFGRLGEQLRTFVLRLGSLFSESQRRPSQSEPEVTHFSITKGALLDDDSMALLREATKWSVLYETRETKKKALSDPESFEYILNPIYAPYFHISYRKKRKLELSTSDFQCIARGSIDEFRGLLRSYQTKWKTNSDHIIGLFD